MIAGIQKNTFLLTISFTALACIVAFIVGMLGMKAAVPLLAGILATAFLSFSLANLKFGVVVIFLLGAFLSVVKIYAQTDAPLGVAVDGLLFLMFISAYIKSRMDHKPLLKPGTFNTIMIVFFSYQFLEVLNPAAYSRTAWLFAFRQMFSISMIYFVFSYAINDLKFLTSLIKLWIGIALLAALYGLVQEFLGFRDFEMAWLNANPEVALRYFTFGKWRRFSFFTGPMDFGIIMAFSSMFCVALAFGPFSPKKKISLAIAAIIMLWAMMYTGTRTAYVLLPAGFVFFAFLTFKKNILIALAVFLIMGLVVILRPATNQTMFVIQTAFSGQKDASYMVREKNKQFIRPYIWSHPFGGGIGSSGMTGHRYAPGTLLSNFPPDSEFVKVAVEQGWVGLAIFCLLFFFALKTGITNYFLVTDPKIKTYYSAFLTSLFMITVASYPQEALQLSINVFLGTTFAVLIKMKEMDDLIPEGRFS